jgi:hypothetical protein
MPKQTSGGKMKKIVISLTAAAALSACSDQPAGNEYFDHISPVPASLQQQTIAPGEPIPAPAPSPTNVDAEGVPYETVTVNVDDTTPAAQPATTAAPAPGLFEPSLSVPTEGEAPKKKRETKAPTQVALKEREKALNLREYGATQTHLVGEKVYSRSASKYESGNNCDQYTVPEIAQIAFLNAGGPKRDNLLLDADGDGFACAWVPAR